MGNNAALGGPGRNPKAPKKILIRRVKAECYLCANGCTWGWKIITGAFWLESSPRRNIETEEKAKANAEWVCDKLGLIITSWETRR